MAKEQKCERCCAEEHIPDFQFIKFDGAYHCMCKRCWDSFLKHFHGAGKVSPKEYQPEIPQCTRCNQHEIMPTHQTMRFQEKNHVVCKRCWDGFKKWYWYGSRAGTIDHGA